MQTGITAVKRREIGKFPSISREGIGTREGIYVPREPKRTPRKAVDTVKSNRPHSLDKKEFYNELCVQLKQGSFDVRNNFVANLYKCLKNHPDYQNDLIFTQDMEVNKIVSLIRNKINDLLPENCNTTIDVDRYGDNTISVSSHIEQDLLSSQNAMPLKWLLKLKRENPKLFVIVRNVISLIKGKYKIDGPDDGFAEMAKEYFLSGFMENEDENDFKHYSKDFFEHCSKEEVMQLQSYYDNKFLCEVKAKDGVGHLLLDEINDIYKMIDEDWLMNQINTYNPRNEMYKTLLDWAKQGMNLYFNHNNVVLSDIIFVTEEELECGTPVTAMDFLKFEWNFNCEYWEQGIEMALNEHAGQFGVIEPRNFIILQEDNYINHFDEKYELFGKELEHWFDTGTDIYYKQIRDWE